MTPATLPRTTTAPGPPATLYVQVITSAFTLSQSARIIAYLPTIWAVWTSGHSTEHSLLTWMTWLCANLSMTCWLFEQAGRVRTRAVLINIGNTAMCFLTLVVIAVHRL